MSAFAFDGKDYIIKKKLDKSEGKKGVRQTIAVPLAMWLQSPVPARKGKN